MATGDEAGNNGTFRIPEGRGTRVLVVIASDGLGWEHVSVHAVSLSRKAGRKTATPNWDEMCVVKDLFWDPEDWCVQYHPAHSEYVTCHPHVLHIWRPVDGVLPVPEHTLVGPVVGETARMENGGWVIEKARKEDEEDGEGEEGPPDDKGRTLRVSAWAGAEEKEEGAAVNGRDQL